MAKTPKKPAAEESQAPVRPGSLAHGRWLGDFPDLSAAELRLVDCCARGEAWEPDGWDGERPTEKSDANTIRAELIRFLALGGDAKRPVHEEGVMVRGAWISGVLNLHQCRAVVRLNLKHCHFDSQPNMMGAHLPELALSGSRLPGLDADNLKVARGVFLREDFAATGEVRLLGAEIGGNLEFTNASIVNKDGNALNADGIRVAGDMFLNNGFDATGEVRLLGADIGGDLDCGNGIFTNGAGDALSADRAMLKGNVFLSNGFASTGAVRLLGAEIGGNLVCGNGSFSIEGGVALNAEGMNVPGSVFLRDATVDGTILLSAANFGTLIDDSKCWQAGGHVLDGLLYDRITGPTDAASRIAWLKSQRPDHLDTRDWKPQPWEQLIKVLREMGHPGAAAEVAMEKQRMMRAAGQIGTRQPNTRFKQRWRRWLDARWTPVSNALARGFHDFYGWIAGYGYRPTRIAGRMALVWLICAGLYWAAADQYGAIGPADPVIASPTLYPEADKLCGHGNEPGKARWTECPGVPDEYSTFQPLIYSLDVILPLIDLQQESDWAPIAEGPTGRDLPMGVFARWLMWFEILFGWVASLMFVAIVSRLVDKD
jgi:hypothetical protein